MWNGQWFKLADRNNKASSAVALEAFFVTPKNSVRSHARQSVGWIRETSSTSPRSRDRGDVKNYFAQQLVVAAVPQHEQPTQSQFAPLTQQLPSQAQTTQAQSAPQQQALFALTCGVVVKLERTDATNRMNMENMVRTPQTMEI